MDERQLQEQIDELRSRMDANSGAIGDLQKAGSVDRADIDRLQAAGEVDRHLIAELQADGLLRTEHIRQLEEALTTARVIGTAIGIVMALARCTSEDAFAILSKVSQDTNRKLREVADEVALTGALP